MENTLTFTMKMHMEPMAFGSFEGVRFTFRDWDFTHQATLVLKTDDGPNNEAHKSPLYALQGVSNGEKVQVTFKAEQQRQQQSRENRRDQVKDQIGLRLLSVKPVAESNGSGDREAVSSGARS